MACSYAMESNSGSKGFLPRTLCLPQNIKKKRNGLPETFLGTEQFWLIALNFLGNVSSTGNQFGTSVNKKKTVNITL